MDGEVRMDVEGPTGRGLAETDTVGRWIGDEVLHLSLTKLTNLGELGSAGTCWSVGPQIVAGSVLENFRLLACGSCSTAGSGVVQLLGVAHREPFDSPFRRRWHEEVVDHDVRIEIGRSVARKETLG